MSKSLIAVFLLLVSPVVAADVYKCPKPDGRMVYQNFPCPIDSIGSEATQAPPKAPIEPAVKQRNASDERSANTVATAANSPTDPIEPIPGMTEAQARASTWGEPISITEEKYPQGPVKVWAWDDNRRLIFNLGGRVTSVQR